MSTSIGIDFGTTTSSIAVTDNAEPRLIPNARGLLKTPTAIGLTTEENLCVGRRALARGRAFPDEVVPTIKRLLGGTVTDPVVRRYRRVHSVELRNDEGGISIQLGEQDYTPKHLVSAYLAEMRRAAERYLGEAVSGAVLTTPAFFTDSERKALQEAARVARLEVRRLINAPTAVGIDHGRLGPEKATHVVVDLGGGYFDATVLTRNRGTFEVEATAGTTSLGGWDLDVEVYDWLVDACLDFVDGSTLNPVARAQLLRTAHAARCELSEASRTWVSIPELAEGEQVNEFPIEFKRSTFESLVANQIDEVESTCERVLGEAGLDAADIDELSVVGGLGATPVFRRRIESVFGMEATDGEKPEGAAARGAALQAGVLSGDIEEFVMFDVTPMDIGLRIEEDGFLPIVPRNTPIPTTASGSVTTRREGQTEVTIEVLQGNHDRASDNQLLGMFTLTGMPKAAAGEPEISVTFEVDSDGRLEISAEEMETGTEQTMTVDRRNIEEKRWRPSVDQFTSDGGEESDRDLAEWIEGIDDEGQMEERSHEPGMSITTIEDEAVGAEQFEQSESSGGVASLGKQPTAAKQDEVSSESAPKSWRRRYEDDHDEESGVKGGEDLRESQALRLNQKLENLEQPETWEEAQAYFSRGFRAHKKHNYAEALQYFTRAYQFDDENPLFQAFYAYVTFLSNPDEFDRCKALLREAVAQRDPKVAPDAHFFLGRLLKAEEEDEHAKHHFQKALEWDPDLEGARRELEFYEKHDN